MEIAIALTAILMLLSAARFGRSSKKGKDGQTVIVKVQRSSGCCTGCLLLVIIAILVVVFFPAVSAFFLGLLGLTAVAL